MTTSIKITKAKSQLLVKEPFYALLLLRLKFIEDNGIDTAATNGREIRYNAPYIDSLTNEELKGLLAHEVLHVALLHHTRRGNRDAKIWNYAADYAINPLLLKSSFVLPKGHLYKAAYLNKSAEEIYNLLLQSSVPHPPSSMGEIEDLPKDQNVQEAEAKTKQAFVQAATMARRQGNFPGHLEVFIDEILTPKIDWRESLARFLSELAKNDYNWSKPNVRYLSTGFFLPSLENKKSGKVILLIDTSSSVSQSLLNQFASEVQDISNSLDIPLFIIYVDTVVQGIQEIEQNEPVVLTPIGRGGTDFRPGFDYIEEYDLQPKAVVYLTDGECQRFPKEPDYNVLWAKFGSYRFDPPFGEVIEIL